jgi:hypothetical protein
MKFQIHARHTWTGTGESRLSGSAPGGDGRMIGGAGDGRDAETHSH